MEKKYEITESKINELFKYLGDVPFKYSNAIIGFLKQNLTDVDTKAKTASSQLSNVVDKSTNDAASAIDKLKK